MRLARLAAILPFLPFTAGLHAAPIDFTEMFTGSVTLGSTTYNNKTVTLYGVGDTSAVTRGVNGYGDPYFLDNVTATFSISGGPSGTFTVPVGVYSDNYGGPVPGGAGFDTADDDNEIIGTLNNTAFADYELNASIGPVSGAASGDGYQVGTNKGLFTVDTVSGNTSFQAVTSNVPVTPSPVPEPSSLALLGTGVLGLAGMVRRRYARL